MSLRDKVLKNQAVIETPEDVDLAIEEARTVARMNELRTSLVRAMKTQPYLLKKLREENKPMTATEANAIIDQKRTQEFLDSYQDMFNALEATKEYFINYTGVDILKLAELMLKITSAINKAKNL